jgi:2-keto-3-deoxy-L-fuconate dehydrogenase
MPGRLAGKRALVTFADTYMGPVIAERFDAEGAEVVADTSRLEDTASVEALVEAAGRIDVLVANTAEPPYPSDVESIPDEQWMLLFDRLTHPLMRVVRAVTPQMKERQQGKIIAVTSSAPLQGIPKVSGYCAARGAQNAFLRAVGLELAQYNVQVNAIAQNYVANDVYYPDDLIASERFRQHLDRMVPGKRVAPSGETAELAVYLAGEHSTHRVGQVIPFSGGWATTTG